MDFFMMILIICVITLHSIPDKLSPPIDIIYLAFTSLYSLALFLDNIMDSPFIHSETTRTYRSMSFVLIVTSLYTVLAKIMLSLEIISDVKHFINILLIVPLTAKLTE